MTAVLKVLLQVLLRVMLRGQSTASSPRHVADCLPSVAHHHPRVARLLRASAAV
jgi:hypothetical protein